MKGKNVFTAREADQIREWLRRKAGADRVTQTRLRNNCRKLGFYITDYTSDVSGFLPQDFDDLVRRGTIRIIDDAGYESAPQAQPQLRSHSVSPADAARNAAIAPIVLGSESSSDFTDFSSMGALKTRGFVGFRCVRELQLSQCREVADEAGVYMIVRGCGDEPRFNATSCGGRFKGRDPSVSADVLRLNWIPSTPVLYIGKAGGAASKSTLRKRLKSYMEFGSGRPVGHWGGRYIWHLSDAAELLVCWMPSGSIDAVELETRLLREFASKYGGRPFANLRD